MKPDRPSPSAGKPATGADAARPSLTDHAFERLLEAHADGDISPQGRRVLEAELANSPARRAQFERSERLLLALSRQAGGPDLSESILDRLEDRGVLLPSRRRRVMRWARTGLAASVVIGLGALIFVERHNPGSTPLASSAPAPVSSVVSSVVEAGKNGVDTSARQVRQAVQTLQAEILPRVELERVALAGIDTPERPKALGLKLGNTSKLDNTMKWTVGQGPVKTEILAARQESALSAILAEPDETGVWLGMEIRPGVEMVRVPMKNAGLTKPDGAPRR